MKTDILISKDNLLVAAYSSICESEKILVINFYQDKHILSWLRKHLTDIFSRKSDSKEYSLLYFFSDVIRYNQVVIEKIVNISIPEINIIPSRNRLNEAIEQDHLYPDEYGPRSIIMILVEKQL